MAEIEDLYQLKELFYFKTVPIPLNLNKLTWNHVGCRIGSRQPIGGTDRRISRIWAFLTPWNAMSSSSSVNTSSILLSIGRWAGFGATFHYWHFVVSASCSLTDWLTDQQRFMEMMMYVGVHTRCKLELQFTDK